MPLLVGTRRRREDGQVARQLGGHRRAGRRAVRQADVDPGLGDRRRTRSSPPTCRPPRRTSWRGRPPRAARRRTGRSAGWPARWSRSTTGRQAAEAAEARFDTVLPAARGARRRAGAAAAARRPGAPAGAAGRARLRAVHQRRPPAGRRRRGAGRRRAAGRHATTTRPATGWPAGCSRPASAGWSGSSADPGGAGTPRADSRCKVLPGRVRPVRTVYGRGPTEGTPERAAAGKVVWLVRTCSSSSDPRRRARRREHLLDGIDAEEYRVWCWSPRRSHRRGGEHQTCGRRHRRRASSAGRGGASRPSGVRRADRRSSGLDLAGT